jgi:hypothetical protein
MRLESRYYLTAFAGAILLALGGMIYRTDQVRCGNWPPLSTGLLYAPVYLLAIGLLSVAWIGLSALCLGQRRGPLPLAELPSPARIVTVGVLLNLCGLLVPPFLADDALAYAAVGRAIQHYGANMYTPLGQALPAGDPFRQMIAHQASWLQVGSAYSPAFNWLASTVSRVAGDDLTLHLRLFQGVGLGAMLLSTLLIGQAAKEWSLQERRPDDAPLAGAPSQLVARQVAARAMALILFCPLTLIEGVNNAHNDSLLSVSVALFALFVVRRQPFAAFLALLLGPLVKASGLLLLALYALHLLLSRWQLRLPQSSELRAALLGRGRGLKLALGGLAVAVAVTALTVWLLPLLWRYSSTTAHLLGSPRDQYPYCTRSIECIPRAILHVVLGLPTAAWLVGLCFRAASGVFLLYVAVRSERGARHLKWAASFLFFYYLYLHSYSHTWYMLSLLPLLAFADSRLLPAMMAMAVSNLSHYVLNFAFDCEQSVFLVGLTELVEGLLVIVPPTVVLIAGSRRGRGEHTARRTRGKP